MESNQHEESKSSSEETDRSEQNDDIGIGRSYECVFCKRGFTTAQALGGHMNIHRKDRSKPRPSSVPSIASKVDEDLASSRACPPFQTYPPHYPTAYHHEVHINCHPFFPASPCGFRPSHAQYSNDVYVQNRQHLNLFEEDWQKGLSLQIGPPHGEENQVKMGDGSESDELDLELRLGHDP